MLTRTTPTKHTHWQSRLWPARRRVPRGVRQGRTTAVPSRISPSFSAGLRLASTWRSASCRCARECPGTWLRSDRGTPIRLCLGKETNNVNNKIHRTILRLLSTYPIPLRCNEAAHTFCDKPASSDCTDRTSSRSPGLASAASWRLRRHSIGVGPFCTGTASQLGRVKRLGTLRGQLVDSLFLKLAFAGSVFACVCF